MSNSSHGEVILYVAGFLFSPDRQRVLLIRKNRPDSQAGQLNGVGGRIKDGEEPMHAMHREFREEAGIIELEWEPTAILFHSKYVVHFFEAFDHAIDIAYQASDEPIVIINVEALSAHPIVSDLNFLIPIALDQTGLFKPVLLANVE